jgi:LysM repeat protein
VKRQTCVWFAIVGMLASAGGQCQHWAMKIVAMAALILAAFVSSFAQTSGEKSNSAQLEALAKKIDEQNAKIDTLSQQILRLQEQLSKPGVMIGEATPAPTAGNPPAVSAVPPSGNTHIVARGETLTSIAKQYKVGVEELQKFNHIADDRKLQAGQTIVIPTPGSVAPAISPASSPVPDN